MEGTLKEIKKLNPEYEKFIRKALYKLAGYEDCITLSWLRVITKPHRLEYIKGADIQCRVCHSQIKITGLYPVYCPFCRSKLGWDPVKGEHWLPTGEVILPEELTPDYFRKELGMEEQE